MPGQEAYGETEPIGKRNRVTVNIVGEEYIIRSDADTDHVRELAESVDERMKAALAMNPQAFSRPSCDFGVSLPGG